MKLPMIPSGLPARRGQTRMPVKKDFDQALALLRKASGKPEYRHIPMRCAAHDRPFVIIYRRDDPDEKFCIEKISKDVAASNRDEWRGSCQSENESDSLTVYNNREFNSAGRRCPWCQDPGAVHCGSCKETYCGGATREIVNGVSIYRCVPRCGSSGDLVDYDKLHGNRAVPALEKSQKPMLAKRRKKALPQPKRPLLPGW